MTRVQFREDEEVVRYVEGQGLNANEFARAAFQEAVRRLRATQKLAGLQRASVPLGGSAADLVRAGREER